VGEALAAAHERRSRGRARKESFRLRPERSFCKQTARPVKWLSVFWLLGLAIAITLVVAQGFGTIARTFASSGWCVAVISLYHVLPLAVSSMAWAVLIERRLRPSK
jgi:hypothetical protein